MASTSGHINGGNDRVPIVPKVEHTRPDGITLTYNLTEGHPIRIDLRRSLAGRTFLDRQGERNESIVEYFEESCFYQGRIEHRPDSLVALSTCEGKIRGTVYDRSGTYYIDFDEAAGGHYVQRC